MTFRVRAAAVCLPIALAIANAAHAQDASAPPPAATISAADSALEARTSEIAATLRCPVCQGESIQDSPAELAQEMRGVVRDQLRAGKSPDEIRAYFVQRYGEWILLEPKMTGLNILLYAFPVILVAGGVALVVVLVRRWTSAEARTEPALSDDGS